MKKDVKYKGIYNDPKEKERFNNLLKENLIPKVIGSDLKQQIYDDNKILEALKRETGLSGKKAYELVKLVSRYLIGNDIKFTTAPMIREVVNSFCLKLNLETTRLKHTRIGIPKWDLDDIFKNNGKEDKITKSINLLDKLLKKIRKIESPSIILKDMLEEELTKIKDNLNYYFFSSDYIILKRIKNENENVNKLIKLLEEGKKFEEGDL